MMNKEKKKELVDNQNIKRYMFHLLPIDDWTIHIKWWLKKRKGKKLVDDQTYIKINKCFTYILYIKKFILHDD